MEEKQLDTGVDQLLQRIAEIKASIAVLIHRLETEHATLQWPSVLDSFALISGQLSTLNKVMKSDKMPVMRQYTVLPLAVSPVRDEALEKLTEGRVPVLSHEVMPVLLRTKPEPEVEQKIQQINSRAMYPSSEVQKQVANINKCVSQLLEIISRHKEEWEQQMGQKNQLPVTHTMADTNTLLAAVNMGKVFRTGTQPADTSPAPGSAPPTTQANGNMQAKAPSAVRTNIKAAGPHPYGRN